MQFYFIIWLVFAVLVALFAALNADAVTVKLIFREFRTSLAMVILASAFMGSLIGYTIDLVPKVKARLRIRELEKKLKATESDLESCRGKLNTLTAAPAKSDVQENTPSL